jgi:hypothetical protein
MPCLGGIEVKNSLEFEVFKDSSRVLSAQHRIRKGLFCQMANRFSMLARFQLMLSSQLILVGLFFSNSEAVFNNEL